MNRILVGILLMLIMFVLYTKDVYAFGLSHIVMYSIGSSIGSSNGTNTCENDYIKRFEQVSKNCSITAVSERNEKLVFTCYRKKGK